MTLMLDRRALLMSVGAAIAAAGTAGFPAALFAQAPITVEQFLAISEKLIGRPSLDAAAAKTLLGGFLATGNGPALAKLAAGQDVFGPVANAIVGSWYSGLYNTADGQAVAIFTDALVWNALTFTKPWGYCGGATGFWADPPEA